MARICNAPGCSNTVFTTDRSTGKGYCARHKHIVYSKRDWYNKPYNKQKTKKGMEVSKSKDIASTGVYVSDIGIYSEKELFDYIWRTREHKCIVSGVDLNRHYNTQFWFNCFAHVLSKAKNKYYRFKYLPENIQLVSPEVHMLYDFGTEQQRLDYGGNWNALYKLRDKLINEYKKL